MITEMPGPADRWIQQTSSSSTIPPEEVVMQYVNNRTSVQTGEEFSLEFLHDRACSRVAPAVPGVVRNQEMRVALHDNQNNQEGYEDLAKVLRSINSECGSDVTGSASAKGSTGNGIYVDNEYGLRNEDSSFQRGVSKATNGICHEQVDSSAPRFTRSASGQSSQPSALRVSDDSQSGKVKFLCSFGGKILPRPSDGKLRYVGGETRIISISKNISWEELLKKTSEICKQPHTIKYQLPGEDLDALISVSSDEDLQNMIEEYYSIEKLGGSQRLRIFLIPLTESENLSTIDSSSIPQGDPDYQYVVAVNGIMGIDVNPQQYCNGQSLASDVSLLDPTVNQNASFNSLSSWNPSQIVNGVDIPNSMGFVNEPLDTSMPAKHGVPFAPLIIHQVDLKNDYPQFLKDKSSPGSPILVSTALLPPETSSNNVFSYYDIPQAAVDLMNRHNNASKNDIIHTSKLVEPVSHVRDTSTETLASPILEFNDSDFQECSFERIGIEQRTCHSEKQLSHPDDVMGALLGCDNSSSLNHRMPHTFSDSKLQKHGGISTSSSCEGISQSFSLNITTPQLSVLADLREKPVQQHKKVEIFNPQLQSKALYIEPIVSNQGMDCRNIPVGTEVNKAGSVHWDINENDEKRQLAKAKSHKHDFVMRNHEENGSSCNLMNDNGGFFCDNKSPVAATETMNIMPNVNVDQVSHVGLNNLNQNMQVHMRAVPVSQEVGLKPSADMMMEQKVKKQLASTRTAPGESQSNMSCALNLETVRVVHNSEENSCDSNRETDLIPELCDGFVSHKSSMHKDMGFKETVLMNCTESFSSAVVDDAGQNTTLHSYDMQNLNQNAAFKREYSLLDDEYINNVEQNMANFGDNNCCNGEQKPQNVSFGKFQKKSAAVVEEWNLSAVESATFQHQVDIVPTDGPVPTPIEPESTLQDLGSENENSNAGSINESITDAMIAELEADVYGLQIIRNADLEELRELGSGTYGTVYHGRWRGTDVAIKRIRKACFSGRSSEQERLIKDFWKEARILSNLHHPNVVALYGVVPDGTGGTLATVTEYMANGSLRGVLLKKDRLLDGHRKLIIAMDAAFGMEYLHSKNIIHFDLKCDNLLVNLRDPQRPICKVGDFGLSKVKHNTLVTGGIRGTLPWMAPELLNGSTNLVSEKVDVFSFGVAMWEILTGEEPYANMHYGAIIGGIVKNTLRPPIPERCDPDWRKLMEQCWSTNPEERPSFTEITRRLRSMSASLLARR